MLENFDHIRTISISPEREREREETTEALNLELLGQRVVGSTRSTSVSGFILAVILLFLLAATGSNIHSFSIVGLLIE